MFAGYSRRQVLANASLSTATVVLGGRSLIAGEPPPETTTIRLRKSSVICFAPLYILESYLRAEGFTDIQYPDVVVGTSVQKVERGDVDFDSLFAGAVVNSLEAGAGITVIAGLHAGCYELFAHESIRSISDLKGKRVGIHQLNSGKHTYVSIMAAHVGLDPGRDIDWVTSVDGSDLDLFAVGKTDAFLGFPPEPQELRDRGLDHVVVNTTIDRPWSQYFCCMIYGNRSWVQHNPIATKRFLRALVKAADFCTAEPEIAARQLVDGSFAERYDHALETIKSVEYRRWRDYDAEDSLRFYALRQHEVGMIDTSPNKLIAEGTDWRFLDELKQELRT